MKDRLYPMLLAALMAVPTMFVACDSGMSLKEEITITISGSVQVEVAKLYGLWSNEKDEAAPTISFFDNGIYAEELTANNVRTGNYLVNNNVIELNESGKTRRLKVLKLNNDSLYVEEGGQLALYRKSAGSYIAPDTYKKRICATWHVTSNPNRENSENELNLLTFHSDGTCQYVVSDKVKYNMTYMLTADQLLVIDPSASSSLQGLWSVQELSESLILGKSPFGFLMADKVK